MTSTPITIAVLVMTSSNVIRGSTPAAAVPRLLRVRVLPVLLLRVGILGVLVLALLTVLGCCGCERVLLGEDRVRTAQHRYWSSWCPAPRWCRHQSTQRLLLDPSSVGGEWVKNPVFGQGDPGPDPGEHDAPASPGARRRQAPWLRFPSLDGFRGHQPAPRLRFPSLDGFRDHQPAPRLRFPSLDGFRDHQPAPRLRFPSLDRIRRLSWRRRRHCPGQTWRDPSARWHSSRLPDVSALPYAAES